jgi:RNA polymerase sigma-70 factor (sigma-E family)
MVRGRLASTFGSRQSFLHDDRAEAGMASDPGLAGLEEFLAERGDLLLRTAVLLTGSRDAGEDLLQAALERLFRHWPKLRGGDPEGYLRRTIYHLAADGWRREGRRRIKLRLLHATDNGVVPDGSAAIERRDELVRLLLQLPAGQRAVIILRYWEDLSEAEAADVLGCSVGTVKSATSRGLRRLRELRRAEVSAEI